MVSTEVSGAIYRHNLDIYDNGRPVLALSNDVDVLSSQIQSMAFNLLDEFAALPDEQLLVDELRSDPIYKIERNLWKNREHMEEIMDLLDKSRWPWILRQPSTPEDSELAGVLDEIADVFRGPLANLVSFQDMISERVFNAVTALLPQSIRRILIRIHEDEEMHWKEELDCLVTSGASKGARCALLREQHTNSRSKLIALSASMGFFETSTEQNEISLRKVVLDAFPTINDENWPMEDQQRRVGPQLYHLTTMIISIRLFVSLLWGKFEAFSKLKKNHGILKKAVDVYIHEFERITTYTREVFDAYSLSTSEVVGCGIGDFEEICVSAWKTHEVSVEMDTANSKIGWDFSLLAYGTLSVDWKNWHIGFSVEYTDDSGETSILLPMKRCRADKGSLVTLGAGKYKLIWDNTDQYLLTKFLRYKLELY